MFQNTHQRVVFGVTGTVLVLALLVWLPSDGPDRPSSVTEFTPTTTTQSGGDVQPVTPVKALPAAQAARAQCLLNTYPVWPTGRGVPCWEWTGKPALTSSGGDCGLTRMTRQEAWTLLSHTQIEFWGDSTARRMHRALVWWLRGEWGTPPSLEDEHGHNNKYTEFTEETQPADLLTPFGPTRGESLPVVGNVWAPSVVELTDKVLRPMKDDKEWNRDLLGPKSQVAAGTVSPRRVFMLSMSTWDFIQDWMRNGYVQGSKRALEFVGKTLEAVRLLKESPFFDESRGDIVMVRAPVSQACSSNVDYPNSCKNNEHPANAYVQDTALRLTEAMSRVHPTSPVIPMFEWTAGENGVGRGKCTQSDDAGTHLKTATAREAALHQVLHTLSIMSQ